MHHRNGTYDKIMADAVAYFFEAEPYASLRPCFDVHFIRTVSENETLAEGNKTVFDLRNEDQKVFEYARKVEGLDPTKSVIGVVEHSGRYINGAAGVCYWYDDNAAVAYYGTSFSEGGFLIQHEICGHGFGKLDEEYIIREGYRVEESGLAVLRGNHARGWCENVDMTDDPASVRWARFLTDPLYRDRVGIFEGAGGCAYGLFRPSEHSYMGRGTGNEEYFNAPSRYSIWKKAMAIAGGDDSWEAFVAFDAPARASSIGGAALRRPAAESLPTAPPVRRGCAWHEAR